MKAIIFDFFGVLYQDGVDGDMLEYVSGLHRTYEIAVFTSGSQEFLAKMFPGDNRRDFDHIFTSSNVENMKPNAAAFSEVAKAMGHDPSECVMIDDSHSNVAGAEEAGLKGIVFTNLEDLRDELTSQ